MANFLASIFGTELDKVNCSFYFVSSALPALLANPRRDKPTQVANILLRRKSARAATATAARGSTLSPRTARRSSCRTCTRTLRTTPRTG